MIVAVDALRRGVDMGLVDVLTHGKAITEPVQYVQGVVNGISAVVEMLVDAGVHVPFDPTGFGHEAMLREIERITR